MTSQTRALLCQKMLSFSTIDGRIGGFGKIFIYFRAIAALMMRTTHNHVPIRIMFFKSENKSNKITEYIKILRIINN